MKNIIQLISVSLNCQINTWDPIIQQLPRGVLTHLKPQNTQHKQGRWAHIRSAKYSITYFWKKKKSKVKHVKQIISYIQEKLVRHIHTLQECELRHWALTRPSPGNNREVWSRNQTQLWGQLFTSQLTLDKSLSHSRTRLVSLSVG